MNKKKQPVKLQGTINPYTSSPRELLKRAERQALLSCLASVAGFPLSFIGFGMIMGIIGLVMGSKTKRPDGTRLPGAIAAMVIGILDIIIAIPGWIVIYGTYINPGSEFVQNLVNAIFGIENLIFFF